jgi:uncharacterized protein (TIGR03437 family)
MPTHLTRFIRAALIAASVLIAAGAQAQPKKAATVTITGGCGANDYHGGQRVGLRAEVKGSDGLVISNAVEFSIDGVAATPTTVLPSGSVVTYSMPALPAGPHTLTAKFAGNADYEAASASCQVTYVKVASEVAVSFQSNNLTFGQTTSVNVIVRSRPGRNPGTPAGTVTVQVKDIIIGPVTLQDGLATVTLPTLQAGDYLIGAAYSGSDYYDPSGNGSPMLTINKGKVSTTLTSSANSTQPGQPVTFTANFTAIAPSPGPPPGTATFSVDGVAAATAPVTAGKATFTTSLLNPGTRTVAVKFDGSQNFEAGQPASLQHTVEGPPCEFKLGSNSRDFTEMGGTGQVKVTATANCNWEAVSSAQWLAVNGYSISQGTVDYTVPPLAGDSLRAGAITIAGQAFNILQKRTVAATSGVTFAVGDVAAEQFVTAFGAGLADGSGLASALPLPTKLAGLEIRVRDSLSAERSAPLFYVSPTQVNYLIPKGTAAGTATITFLRGGQAVSTSTISVARLAPGIFTAPQTGSGPAAALVQRVTGPSVSYEPTARYDPIQAKFVAIPFAAGGADHSFLVLFGTGLRNLTPGDVVAATIGGDPVDVVYAGAQGQYEGLDQINLRLLPTLAGKGLADVKISVNGKAVNTVQVHVQ